MIVIGSGIVAQKKANGNGDPVIGFPGDVNQDGRVDAVDYIALKRNIGKTSGATVADGDLDHDEDVDYDDLAILQVNYGREVGQP